jgi:hypothetical protein
MTVFGTGQMFFAENFYEKFSERPWNVTGGSADGCRRPILPICDLWLVLWFRMGTYHIQGCRNDLEQSRGLKMPIYDG